MKVLKALGVILLSVIVLAVLLYAVGVAVNWRDKPPTAQALAMQALIDESRAIPDEQNAYVYVLGFGASADEDVRQVGARRAAWLREVNIDPKRLKDDPGPFASNLGSSKPLATVRVRCSERQTARCRDSFDEASGVIRDPAEDRQLARYRELLKLERWGDVVPEDPRTPLPPFGDIVNAQRLYFLDLRQRVSTASPAEIRAALAADLHFWRRALASSGILISKMIAVACVRQHFYMGNLVLRQFPKERVLEAVPDEWRQEFHGEELSMRRAMAGEWAFGAGVMRNWQQAQELFSDDWSGDSTSTFGGRLVSSLARPFYQPQDQKNYLAAQYETFAESFEVPLEKYPAAVEAILERDVPEIGFHVYNPVGHIFRALMEPLVSPSYAMRVGATEGMRRAALLTTELRARGVTKEQMADELTRAELRQPFDHSAFSWSTDDEAVTYAGVESDQRRLNAYFY